jgi:WD40 repeat protein
VAFTPDGKAMLTATDYRVHLWDAATARPLEAGMTLTGRSEVMALSSDGKTLATGGPDLRLWDVATGRQLGPALAHPMGVNAIAFSPDGKQVLTGCQDHNARVWSVPQPMRGTVEEVLRWVRVCALLEQHENGALRPIDPQTWQELHRELEQAGSAFTPQ